MFNNDYSMNDLDFGLIVSSMEGQITDDASGINISDVIEVIETDAAFGSMQPRRSNSDATPNGPYVKIIEQPASKALRFRYECEGRSAGSLPGVHSTPENKTFPTIQIANYKGRAVVVVSCVTKDPPYRPHPHNLVGKENCKRGVCTVEVNSDSMTASFANLGIQCVKKKDIEEALKVREEIRVDPFRTGFSHKTQASSIDLNSVRLCFQAFLEGPQRGKFTNPLTPVVSDPIYDKKAMADLVICKLSHCSASVAGGQEVILLCEKVAKEDISIRFFEEKEGHITWEGLADFTPNQVHKQTAISFRTPRYKSLEIENPVQAYIQLRRPSDGETSEALPFQITPLDSDREIKRKRHKYSSENDTRKVSEADHMRALKNDGMSVKREPVTSPNPYLGIPSHSSKKSPMYNSRTPSPLEYQPSPYNMMSGGSTYISSSSTGGGHVYTTFMQQDTSRLQHQPTLGPQQLLQPQQTHQSSILSQATNILNMDTQECSLELNLSRLDSKDLAELNLLDGTLSNTLSSSLILGEQQQSSQINSTDSFTRLANSALNDLCNLNNYQ